MDRFSLKVLKNTVQFAIDAMLPNEDPRVVECVVTILDYADSPGFVTEDAVCAALCELGDLADSSQHFLISDRLALLARRVREEGLRSKAA